MSSTQLKYMPFSSLVDTTFWHILSKKKLDELKLDDQPFPATAVFRNDQADGLPPLVSFDYQSFLRDGDRITGDAASTSASAVALNSFVLSGQVMVCNTLEDFKSRDKQVLLQTAAQKIWHDIEKAGDGKEGEEEARPLHLSTFLLFTYLDLKKFFFYYWFAFPALTWPSAVTVTSTSPVSESLTPDQISSLHRVHSDQSNQQFFLMAVAADGSVQLHKVHTYSALSKSNLYKAVFAAFADPSTNRQFPGWPARNLLSYLVKVHHAHAVKLLSYRVRGHDCSSSLIFEVRVEESCRTAPSEMPPVVGWEKNEKGVLMPRTVDMGHVLDPAKLAQNAVNLNLKLMRWRLIPTLDLDRVARTKVLLLGSGTLGCNVARALLGWGVETITFVDNSRVSFSNPVRQSLFNFEDCLDGGADKATAAANALKRIYPGVKSTGHNMSIPMPGHTVSADRAARVSQTVQQLESLISEHDAVFLLMDTRESRWLPTLIAQSQQKLVINAALGFDTFLVQRHGVRKHDGAPAEEAAAVSAATLMRTKLRGSQLGCYFCNDVVAPGDSTRDRTLDQQCTVTRPGVSMIAAAYAVELLVSVIQHPEAGDAPAPAFSSISAANQGQGSDEEDESCLGIIPHQIRGFLSRFTEVLPATSAFASCTACSDIVVSKYRQLGFDFLLQVFNDCNLLEEVTGLKKLHEETNLDDVWALSDNDLTDSETGSIKSTSIA